MKITVAFLFFSALHAEQTVWATLFSWVSSSLSIQDLDPGEGEAGVTVNVFLTDSPTTTHQNLTSSSLNDISDKPEKDQVSQHDNHTCGHIQ